MDTIAPIPSPEPKPEITPSEITPGEAPSIAKIKLEGFFGNNSLSQQDQQNIGELVRILDGDNKDPVDFLWEINQIEGRIGMPPLGVSRIQHLYNYVRLSSQINKLEKERAAYGS